MAVLKTDLRMYPEEYILEEDEIGESSPQFRLIMYLVEIIERYYRNQTWLVTGNLELYHQKVKNTQRKIVLGVAVFKGIEISLETRQNLSSWTVSEQTPMPPLVFEISSASTWRNAIGSGEYHKPAIYKRLGVQEYFAYDTQEYFAYDPQIPELWAHNDAQRLKGWRYGYENGEPTMQEIRPNPEGWLESEVLDGWLVPAGVFLQLYNRQGVQQSTAAEAEQV